MSDFKAKMHKIRFLLGLRPRPAYNAPPDPLAVFQGLLLRGGRGKGGREGRQKEREDRGGEKRGGLAPNWGVWIRQ